MPSKQTLLKVLPIIVIFSALVITTIIVKYVQKVNSKAAPTFGYEAENGSIQGPVAIGSDNSASGGKYIQFGQTSSNTPLPSPISNQTSIPSPISTNTGFQPQAPYYATFFYMWYQNPTTDGHWSYWTDHGGNPPSTWFSHYVPDVNPTAFDPANELYSASNYNTFKWQVSKIAESKIEVAIGSWWGQGTKEDKAFDSIINSYMAKSDNPYPNLRWAMYYEQEGFSDPSVTQLVSDLNYIKTKYAASPYFLKINGKPVMFVYAGANDVPGTMTQRWKEANSQVGNTFYIVLKVFPGFQTDPNQPDSWHQYAPASRSGSTGSYYYFVSPGFWLDDGSAERLPRNPADFENAVKQMVNSSAKWKLIETWNEWGEGTSVEPGEQVKTNPTTNKDEVDPNGYQFKNLYVDILNRNLPNLPQGVGRN